MEKTPSLTHELFISKGGVLTLNFSGVFKLRQLPPSLRALFNVPAHTDKQLRQFKSLSLSTMIALLAHKDFMGKVCVASMATAGLCLHGGHASMFHIWNRIETLLANI